MSDLGNNEAHNEEFDRSFHSEFDEIEYQDPTWALKPQPYSFSLKWP